ncbi:MAG: linear amide C-N hydrolase [Acidimicrobiales bacterium]
MCTSLRLTADDGTVLIGRTMEYSLPLNWEWRAVPRGVEQASTAPGGAGARWQGAHGYVGLGIGETTAFGMTVPSQPSVPDGVNEQGLYAGLLYLPTFAAYEATVGVGGEVLLAPIDVASYVLATCSGVAEAVSALESVVVWAAEFRSSAFRRSISSFTTGAGPPPSSNGSGGRARSTTIPSGWRPTARHSTGT